MTKYLFDLVAYRYWQGDKVKTKEASIQIDTDQGKAEAMSKAIRWFVSQGEPDRFVTVEITTARVGDALR